MEEPKLIKRRGITDAAINKQRKILIIAIFCVITLFISTSYALLTNFDKTDNVVVFQTGNLAKTNVLYRVRGPLSRDSRKFSEKA